jgi:SAM-dependent methyltransferase
MMNGEDRKDNMANTSHENWAAGDAYEQFMGKWSEEVACRFLAWLKVEPNQRWLDVGCGTGALTRSIEALGEPQMVVGVDPSLDFVRFAHQQKRITQTHLLVAGGSNLAIMREAFDTIVSGLALNFIPQPEHALLDMRRVVKPGGMVAAYVWDYAGKMEFLRYFWDAAVELNPQAWSMHEGYRFPLCHPQRLNQLWQGAGFNNVVVDAIDIPAIFDTFDDYWRLFTLGNFPAPKYASSLNEKQRHLLSERLRVTIPITKKGAIHLTARAWAVRGYR